MAEVPGYDPSYELVYFNQWSGYEEGSYTAILENNGQMYLLKGGYSVSEGEYGNYSDLERVSETEALQYMIECDEDKLALD